MVARSHYFNDNNLSRDALVTGTDKKIFNIAKKLGKYSFELFSEKVCWISDKDVRERKLFKEFRNLVLVRFRHFKLIFIFTIKMFNAAIDVF